MGWKITITARSLQYLEFVVKIKENVFIGQKKNTHLLKHIPFNMLKWKMSE